jgi:hypothetical protein
MLAPMGHRVALYSSAIGLLAIGMGSLYWEMTAAHFIGPILTSGILCVVLSACLVWNHLLPKRSP